MEAKDLDEAIAIAARIPGATHGSIEVRPVFQMNRYPAGRVCPRCGTALMLTSTGVASVGDATAFIGAK